MKDHWQKSVDEALMKIDIAAWKKAMGFPHGDKPHEPPLDFAEIERRLAAHNMKKFKAYYKKYGPDAS